MEGGALGVADLLQPGLEPLEPLCIDGGVCVHQCVLLSMYVCVTAIEKRSGRTTNQPRDSLPTYLLGVLHAVLRHDELREGRLHLRLHS